MSTNAKQIVLASGNAGKLKEFQTLLRDTDFDIVPQSQFNIEGAEETGLSFVENAILKARHACQHSGLPAIADDSGLQVDALMGKPGIYSARFAEDVDENQDAANNNKLLQSLEGLVQRDRTARFHCALVYMRHAEDPTPIICQGSWEGLILHQPAGENGFGYDPLFWVPEKDCSSAQLSKDQKNAISHRGKAMALLLNELKSQANSES